MRVPAQETYLGRRHAANVQLAKPGHIIRWPTPCGELPPQLLGDLLGQATTVQAKPPLTAAKEEATLQMMTRNGLSWV